MNKTEVVLSCSKDPKKKLYVALNTNKGKTNSIEIPRLLSGTDLLVERLNQVERRLSAAIELGTQFPVGTIIAFDPKVRNASGIETGEIRPLPAGWTICNGNSGAPNLDGRFLRGVNLVASAAGTGGREDIPSDGNHRHPKEGTGDSGFGDDNNDNQFRTGPAGGHDHSGENRPPFYNVIWICKIN